MYDAIVVGARCAGSPTAMLLPGKAIACCSWTGRVSERHHFHAHHLAAWRRDHGAWGLLDRLAATGCPPVALDMIFESVHSRSRGGVTDTNGGRGGFCPRRTILDKLLVDAAVESGAELREEFTVESLIWAAIGSRGQGPHPQRRDHGGASADSHRRRRRAFGGGQERSKPTNTTQPAPRHLLLQLLQRLRAEDIEQYVREYQGAACFPTNDGLTPIAGVWPAAGSRRFARMSRVTSGRCTSRRHRRRQVAARPARGEVGRDGRGGQLFPQALRRGLGARRRCRIQQGSDYGAGHQRRLRGLRELTEALDAGFSGRRPSRRGAPSDYQALSRRARQADVLASQCQLAALEPAPPPMRQLFAALRHNQAATNAFYSALTGSIPLSAFMNPDNIGRFMRGFARRRRIDAQGNEPLSGRPR